MSLHGTNRTSDDVRRAAPYVDRILRDAEPADLPVQVPVKFEMALNVSATARF
jgi:putative ABC transport system substrate-binding protein